MGHCATGQRLFVSSSFLVFLLSHFTTATNLSLFMILLHQTVWPELQIFRLNLILSDFYGCGSNSNTIFFSYTIHRIQSVTFSWFFDVWIRENYERSLKVLQYSSKASEAWVKHLLLTLVYWKSKHWLWMLIERYGKFESSPIVNRPTHTYTYKMRLVT